MVFGTNQIGFGLLNRLEEEFFLGRNFFFKLYNLLGFIQLGKHKQDEWKWCLNSSTCYFSKFGYKCLQVYLLICLIFAPTQIWYCSNRFEKLQTLVPQKNWPSLAIPIKQDPHKIQSYAHEYFNIPTRNYLLFVQYAT